MRTVTVVVALLAAFGAVVPAGNVEALPNHCSSWSLENGRGRGFQCLYPAAGTRWRGTVICSNGDRKDTYWRNQGYRSYGVLCNPGSWVAWSWVTLK